MSKRFDHEQIRKHRDAAGLSRRAVVAAMTGAGKPITEETLYRWEAGKNTPSAADLPALASAIGVAPDDFYSPECPRVASTRPSA